MTDDDLTGPDGHATPEQLAWLDRAVAVLDRLADKTAPVPEADRPEWLAIADGLGGTIPGLYGCEWIHRGWDICLHGRKLLVCRWTAERRDQSVAFWERVMRGEGPKYTRPTKRIPEVSADVLK